MGVILTSTPLGFQSTPPCGGDNLGDVLDGVLPDFNPRPHAGATWHQWSGDHHLDISIHAPMRGRPLRLPRLRLVLRFQSTPPCGGDLLSSWNRPLPLIFQSTPPCGGDLEKIPLLSPKIDFNPRPHAGATKSSTGADQQGRISIHAPMRGRPGPVFFQVTFSKISIHAPMRGRL